MNAILYVWTNAQTIQQIFIQMSNIMLKSAVFSLTRYVTKFKLTSTSFHNYGNDKTSIKVSFIAISME